MSALAIRPRLHACLRGFPAAALELSVDGHVRNSNGRLEELLGRDVVNHPFSVLLDSTSREKWRRFLAGRGDATASSLWELVLEGRNSLELRTFAAVWSEPGTEDTLWLLEYARDLRLEPLVAELYEANAELVQVQRELAKERSRLARTLVQEEQARATAERATARLRALYAISASVQATHTKAETTRQLLAGLLDAVEGDMATMLLVDPDSDSLAVYDSVGPATEGDVGVRLNSLQGLAEQVAATAEPVTVPYVQRSETTPSDTGSVVGVPLLAGNNVIGVVLVSSVTSRQFTAEDVQFLQLVARDMAAGIERARLFEAERAARAEAERAVRLRDEVLRVVAHDLRNPLSGISTATTLLSNDALPAEARHKVLGVLRRAADAMTRLVRDLLDAANIDAGRLSVDLRLMDVASLPADLCEMFRSRAAERDVQLDWEAGERLPLVLADEARLLQLLSNLLDNALRLTPAGGRVQVRVEHIGEAVRLAVSDTGPGIGAEELPHIFNRFWQGLGARRGNAGLGLAIAQGIVEAHHGRLWAESVVGQGSTFLIELPTGPVNLNLPGFGGASISV